MRRSVAARSQTSDEPEHDEEGSWRETMATVAFWTEVLFIIVAVAAIVYGIGAAVWYVETLPPPALP